MEFSGSVLKSDRVFGVRMVKWGCSYHSRTNGGNSPSKPLETEHFSSFVLIFHLSLPKIWHAHPIKILFSKLTRIDLSSHKVWSLEVESCNPSKHLKLGDFLLYFYSNWQQSTWWLNGCHGYHTKVASLILTFWRPRKADLTPHQV